MLGKQKDIKFPAQITYDRTIYQIHHAIKGDIVYRVVKSKEKTSWISLLHIEPETDLIVVYTAIKNSNTSRNISSINEHVKIDTIDQVQVTKRDIIFNNKTIFLPYLSLHLKKLAKYNHNQTRNITIQRPVTFYEAVNLGKYVFDSVSIQYDTSTITNCVGIIGNYKIRFSAHSIKCIPFLTDTIYVDSFEVLHNVIKKTQIDLNNVEIDGNVVKVKIYEPKFEQESTLNVDLQLYLKLISTL